MRASPHWKETAREAQAYRDASVHRVYPSLKDTPQHFKNAYHTEVYQDCAKKHPVTDVPPEQLQFMLAAGEVTATEVTRAFLERAAVAQKLTNCVTELLPEPAMRRAQFLDDYFANHKMPIGPLHGMPISVKEHIVMKGLGINAGCVSRYFNVAEDDAHILKILWKAGAVFHARTTQPQTMMHLETDSNLYGVTTNPYNSDLTPGGSSGGEGALIALGGSCLGIGTDVGGSIRSPAANCGIYGFKPTAFRLPVDGGETIAAGADSIDSVIGPLSTSLEGLRLFMKTIIDGRPWLTEPALISMPWKYTPFRPDHPLKIAVMWHDGVVRPHPPIARALKSLSERLTQVPNVTVVDWEPYLHDEAWAIISSLYFTDGGAEDEEAIAASGEPMLPLTRWIIRENPCVKKLNVKELQYWLEEKEAYRKEYADVWNKTGDENGEGMVDAILCPVAPGVAPRHNNAKYWCYTSQWNLLDYPAVVFPVSQVDPELDVADKSVASLGELDNENRALFDARTFDGLPVSLQLVSRRFEDEKLLSMLEYIKAHVSLPLSDVRY